MLIDFLTPSWKKIIHYRGYNGISSAAAAYGWSRQRAWKVLNAHRPLVDLAVIEFLEFLGYDVVVTVKKVPQHEIARRKAARAAGETLEPPKLSITAEDIKAAETQGIFDSLEDLEALEALGGFEDE